MSKGGRGRYNQTRPKLDLPIGDTVQGPDWTARKEKRNGNWVICIRREDYGFRSLHELAEEYNLAFSTIRDRLARRERYCAIVRAAPKLAKARKRKESVQKNVDLFKEELHERGFFLYKDLIDIFGANSYDYILKLMKREGVVEATGSRRMVAYHKPGDESWIALLSQDDFRIMFPSGVSELGLNIGSNSRARARAAHY